MAKCLPVPVRLKLPSQKLVLAKISNKRPFLNVEVEVVDAYSSEGLLDNVPDKVGAHSRRALIRGGRLFQDLWHLVFPIITCNSLFETRRSESLNHDDAHRLV